LRACVRVELGEAGRAEGVSAVDHDPGDVEERVVVLLAELALVLAEQPTHELAYLVCVEIGRVLRLLKEKCCWVLKLFHSIQIYAQTSSGTVHSIYRGSRIENVHLDQF
jgi:hypothetical protein